MVMRHVNLSDEQLEVSQNDDDGANADQGNVDAQEEEQLYNSISAINSSNPIYDTSQVIQHQVPVLQEAGELAHLNLNQDQEPIILL